jgi:hypothetical protein
MKLEPKPALLATLYLVGFIVLLVLLPWQVGALWWMLLALASVALLLTLGAIWWLLYDLHRQRR